MNSTKEKAGYAGVPAFYLTSMAGRARIGHMKLRSDLTINGKIHRKGTSIPWYSIYPDFLASSQTQGPVNLFHDLRRKRINKLRCLHIFMNLLDLAGPRYYRAYMRILQTPGQ